VSSDDKGNLILASDHEAEMKLQQQLEAERVAAEKKQKSIASGPRVEDTLTP
jgi:hypothetical protein